MIEEQVQPEGQQQPVGQQPEPPYRKKVYDLLSSKFSDFKRTEQEFYTKLDSEPEYYTKVHELLSNKFSDFKRPIGEFKDMLGLKKKDAGASQTPSQSPSQSVGIPAAPSQPVSGLDQQIAQTRSNLGQTTPKPTQKPAQKPTQQTAQKPAQQAPIPAPPAQQLNLAGQVQATRQAIGGTQPAPQPAQPTTPQPTPAKQPFTYNTLETIMQEERDRRKAFESARDQAGFASRFGITTGNLTNSAVEYEKAKRKKDEALTNFKVEISRPVDNIIEGKSKQKLDDFFVNGVFSVEKAQEWAGSIVSQYGGGSFVRDHLTRLLTEKAIEKKDGDFYAELRDKALEKRGINVQQLATDFMKSQQAPIINNFELFKKEKESESNRFLEDAQNKASENTSRFQSFTDALNKQIESGQITREKAVELFNAEKAKYQKTLATIDQAYKNSVRDINISLKRRFARIEDEVKKVTFDENKMLQSLPADIRKKYEEAIAEAKSNFFTSRNAMAKARDIMFNPTGSLASNVFAKSAASGFYNTLSNIGNSFMTDGTSNRFTRWLASFAEDAERNRTAQYGWNNPIVKFSQITGQTLGGSSLQMIPTIALSAVGAGPVAATVLGGLTSAAVESQVQKGQQFEESIASGKTVDQARQDAELAFSENMKNLPLYFVGSFGAFKTFQGAGLKGFGKGLILENIEEIPLSYRQEYTAAKIKDPNLTMAKFIADNPNIGLETAAGTLGMSGTVSVAGKAFNSLQRNVPSPAIQAINQIIQVSDVNTAVSVAEKYFELGVIDKAGLDKIKLEIPKIAESNQKMQNLGVDQDRVVLLSALSDKHSSLKQQAEKETDPSVKSLLQTQLSDVESDIKGITGGTSPYMKFTYPGGTNLSSYMTVREFNALPQNNQEEMIKAADKINVVGDDAVNTQINERKNNLGNAFDIDGAYTNGLTVKDTTDATNESQVQEGRTESNISQPAGAVQGQQEVGQGAGQQGQAQITPTNVSDSNIGSQRAVEEKKADIERRRQEELGNYDEEGLKETYAVGSNQTVEQFINSKYDAELAALSAPQLSNIEIQPAVIAQNAAPFVNEVKTAAPEVETGSTMNIDGTQYTGGGLVVPAASMNTTIEEITPEMVSKFVEDNRGKISGNNFKVGIYKFPNSNRASIDLNIVVPSANRAAALEFGRAAGQESLFDLDTFENVKTGADGTNPMSFTDEQFREIANALENNRVPNVFGQQQTDVDAVTKDLLDELGISTIDTMIANAGSALAETGVTIEVIEDPVEYDNMVESMGGQRGTDGVFVAEDGRIILNNARLRSGINAGRVIWHEASHPVMNIIRNTNRDLYDRAVRGAKQASPSALKWAEENYDTQESIDDETLVEATSMVADGTIDLASLPVGFRQTLIDFVNNVAKLLGFDQVLNDTDLGAFRKLAAEVSEALKSGRSVEGIVGAENVTRIENTIGQYDDASENLESGIGVDVDLSIQARAGENAGPEVEGWLRSEMLKSIEEISNYRISRVIFYDNTKVGQIDLKNRLTGQSVTREGMGGFGYSSINKMQDNNIILAFTSPGQAIQVMKRAEMFPDAIMGVAMQNPLTAHLGNVTTMELLWGPGGMFEISANTPAKERRVVKIFKESLVALQKTRKNEAEINAIQSMIDDAKDAKTISDIYQKVMAPSSFSSRGMLHEYMLQDKPTKITASTRDSHKLLHYNLGIPTLQELSESVSDDHFKNATTGDVVKYVKPFTDKIIYTTDPALFERYSTNPTPEMKNGGYSIELLPSDLSHESYPFVIKGDQIGYGENYVGANDIFADVREKGISKAQSFYNVGRRKADSEAGAVPKGARTYGSPRIQARKNDKSPKKGKDLLADYGWDRKMTEDGKGNYLFFHFSTKDLTKSGIDPRKHGASRQTSREEAMQKPNVSYYYTTPSKESFTGDFGHVVAVPKHKVYPFQKDPLNLYDEAREAFLKEYPFGGFGPNQQVGWIAKIAAKYGFDMVVAKWNGGMMRAETTVKHKPEFYSKPGARINDTVVNPKYKDVVPNSKKKKVQGRVDEEPQFSMGDRDNRVRAFVERKRSDGVSDDVIRQAIKNSLNLSDAEIDAIMAAPQAPTGMELEEARLDVEGEGREMDRGLARRFDTLPSETAARIDDEAKTYFQQTNKQTEEAVNEFMKGKSVEEVADYVVSEPSIPDASLVFMAAITAKKLTPMIEQARQDGNTDLAKRLADKQAAIYNTFAKKATSLGQAVQAFIAFKDDPNATQFYLNKVLNQLKEKGVEVTKDQEDKIRDLLTEVGNAKFGLPKNMAIIKLSSYLNSISPVNGFEVLEAIWYAKILSGITTQSKNLFANLFNTFFEIPVVATRESLKNKSLMPFIYAAKGAVSGFAKGSVVGADIIRTGVKEQDLDKYFGNNILEYFSWGRTKVGQLGGGRVGKVLDFPAFIELSPRALRFVGRGLSAADAMFSSINQEAYANMMAWAQAVQEGKNQPTKNNYKRANEILGNTKQVIGQAKKDAAAEGFKPGTLTFKRRVIELVEESRPEQIEQASEDFGKRVTLNYEPEGFIRPIYNMIVRAQQEARLLKVWIPFTRIVANLTEQMLNYSPAGYYKAITGKRNPFGGGTKLTNEERGDLAIKATMGLAAVGVLASLVGDEEDDMFEITANGTGNIQKNYELQKEGWRPFTITLKDGTKINYADWPIRGILAGIGAYRDGVKYGDSEDGFWDRTTLFGYGMMASMYESSLMKGLAEFIDVFRPEQTGKAENVGEGVSKWAAQQAKSVTLSNFTQQALKFVDEYQGDPMKEAKGAAILYRDIPVLNDGLNPIIDVFGDPVSPTTSERLVPAYTIPEEKKDEMVEFLHSRGIFVGVPKRPNIVNLDDMSETPATDEQYYQFRKVYGQTMKNLLYEFMGDYKNEDDEMVKAAVKKIKEAANKQATFSLYFE